MLNIAPSWVRVTGNGKMRGVLEHFGGRIGTARRRYKIFVEKGVLKGRCPELVGGGLIRSSGGREAVKAMRRAKVYRCHEGVKWLGRRCSQQLEMECL